MAIRRARETTSNTSDKAGTHAPSSALANDYSDEHQTGDIKQIQNQYRSDAESKKDDTIDTGALLPKDMTVKLVRAENSNWETFLQCLYSTTLTLFGLFLGSWLSSDESSSEFTSLEITATISFGALSFVLIIIWIILKLKQAKRSIKVPYEMLNQLSEEDT